MSKEDKIEEAAKQGGIDRQGRLNQGIAEKIIGGVGGTDLDYHPPKDEKEKEAYDKEYFNK